MEFGLGMELETGITDCINKKDDMGSFMGCSRIGYGYGYTIGQDSSWIEQSLY